MMNDGGGGRQGVEGGDWRDVRFLHFHDLFFFELIIIFLLRMLSS
jgi:hypothetical protein